ncbi:MAG: monofunctional biosynthetic peptidoglycan transglycosylase [Shimia sp.]
MAKRREGLVARVGRGVRAVVRRVFRLVLVLVVLAVVVIAVGGFVRPPTTPFIVSEAARLGQVDRTWVSVDDIAPVMLRSAVAAEDANFCEHWGFDTAAIRAALESGAVRGGSTITQQVAKNVYLWHGRSWFRKGLEALITPVIELTWSKRRILEVYLNVAEFDEGVFGVEAAARRYFGVGPEALTQVQAARLAMVLPNPKGRDAASPSATLRRRSAAILDGAETIRRDGRAACFTE